MHMSHLDWQIKKVMRRSTDKLLLEFQKSWNVCDLYFLINKKKCKYFVYFV